ncbi:d(CMP) kinase [Streptomyces sp. NBC_00554]|uniref:(d)CMP kinase n=1 Tax=Streptomyces sp. NBC_00554 TaxID=2903661 RepID=UPI00352E82A6
MKDADVVSIDGPIGSGKSSVAFELARLLGRACISTGLMYRTVALMVRHAEPGKRADAACRVARTSSFTFSTAADSLRIHVDGTDFTDEVSDPSILPLTSEIAQDPALRTALLGCQQKLALEQPSVIEGRDANTLIVPNARWKFYLDAPPGVRYRRLHDVHKLTATSPQGYAEFVRTMEVVDERDRVRLSESNRRADVIYHENFAQLSAYQDAVILYYYISRSKEIRRNASILRTMSAPTATS